MGERHLVYVRVDDKIYQNHTDEEIYYNRNVIGIHVQWLLGYSAFNSLVNMIDFHNKNIVAADGKKVNFSPFQLLASDFLHRSVENYTNAEKILQALYTVCPITGFWETSAKILHKTNFFYYDNNTGITVVDFLNFDKPKYCFIIPGTAFINNDVRILETCNPLDAKTYLTAFGESPKGWPDNHLTMLLNKISEVKLLSKEELYDIFIADKTLSYEPNNALHRTENYILPYPKKFLPIFLKNRLVNF